MECNDDDDDRKTFNSQEREEERRRGEKAAKKETLTRDPRLTDCCSNQFLHFLHWLVSPSFLLFLERDEGLEREWGPVLRLSISHSCNKSPLTRVPTCNFKFWSKRKAIQCNPRRCLLRVSFDPSRCPRNGKRGGEDERVQTYKESRDGRREKKEKTDRQDSDPGGEEKRQENNRHEEERGGQDFIRERLFFPSTWRRRRRRGTARDFRWWMTQRSFFCHGVKWRLKQQAKRMTMKK